MAARNTIVEPGNKSRKLVKPKDLSKALKKKNTATTRAVAKKAGTLASKLNLDAKGNAMPKRGAMPRGGKPAVLIIDKNNPRPSLRERAKPQPLIIDKKNPRPPARFRGTPLKRGM